MNEEKMIRKQGISTDTARKKHIKSNEGIKIKKAGINNDKGLDERNREDIVAGNEGGSNSENENESNNILDNELSEEQQISTIDLDNIMLEYFYGSIQDYQNRHHLLEMKKKEMYQKYQHGCELESELEYMSFLQSRKDKYK